VLCQYIYMYIIILTNMDWTLAGLRFVYIFWLASVWCYRIMYYILYEIRYIWRNLQKYEVLVNFSVIQINFVSDSKQMNDQMLLSRANIRYNSARMWYDWSVPMQRWRHTRASKITKKWRFWLYWFWCCLATTNQNDTVVIYVCILLTEIVTTRVVSKWNNNCW
jgi:hypothetical protein